jgi:hypothetical protein
MPINPKEPCGEACGFIATERNRYFTGKYMTARDFQGEQQYFRSRHQLHNRLLHGWGVVCGLRVLHHPNKECAATWVVVRAGIALDCCGRELVLPSDTPLELPLPAPPPTAAAGDGEAPSAAPQEKELPPDPYQSDDGVLLLCLRYAENEIEQVPALYNEGICDPKRREANRVREVAALEFLRPDQVDPTCWKTTEGDPDKPCRDDCDDELPGPAGICLEPECPCGHTVPLALIRFNPADPAGGFEIDMNGRRELPLPQEFHTHIVGINWPHGGDVTLSHLRENMNGRLEVRFDRKLLPADGHKTGISALTFIVQYGGLQRDVKFLPFRRDHPPNVEDDCLAVFHINHEYINPEEENNVADNWVYITLKCDFILDCHNNPVDGVHLKGRLPSGDGRPGGDFESWFRVLPDREGDRERRGRHYEEEPRDQRRSAPPAHGRTR